MTYVNYNRHGQNIGHNSDVPHEITINGNKVMYKGTISQKAFDMMNERNLVSHTVTGEYDTLYCTSADAAQQVAALLAQNPNYARNGA